MPARDSGQLGDTRLLGEADDAEVRLVDAQEQRGVRSDRPLVVGGAGPVRRPDLDEAGAGASEHVRDPEAVADLDQLPARDDDLAALGERGERKQDRGGVVVDDQRRLGTREPAQERREVILARAAGAAREVVLEVGVARGLAHPRQRALGERRAAEIRVHEHPGCVEHAAQSRPARRRQLGGQPRAQVAGIGAGADLLARTFEHRSRCRRRRAGRRLPRAARPPRAGLSVSLARV